MLCVLSVFVLLFGHIYLEPVADDVPDCETTTKRFSNKMDRIVGGHPTTIRKHPWQVSIRVRGMHLCGGSVITPDIIVTAAHCYDRSSARLYSVVTGVTDLRKARKATPVKTVVVNERYSPSTFDYDIALMKLSEKLKFSADVQPIKLPDASLDIPAGTEVTASGWGDQKFGSNKPTYILREVQLDIEDREKCKKVMKRYSTITERMICAGVLGGGKDACQGDSGGPLQHKGTLIGISSWGIGCGRNLPGIYSNVRNLRSWIQQHAGV